jgi:hypothetical protein
MRRIGQGESLKHVLYVRTTYRVDDRITTWHKYTASSRAQHVAGTDSVAGREKQKGTAALGPADGQFLLPLSPHVLSQQYNLNNQLTTQNPPFVPFKSNLPFAALVSPDSRKLREIELASHSLPLEAPASWNLQYWPFQIKRR